MAITVYRLIRYSGLTILCLGAATVGTAAEVIQDLSRPSDWERLLDKYGWPAIILTAVLILVYKKLIPWMQRNVEETKTALSNQLTEAHKARDAALEQFMDALKEQSAGFDKIADRLDGLTHEVRRTSRARKTTT